VAGHFQRASTVAETETAATAANSSTSIRYRRRSHGTTELERTGIAGTESDRFISDHKTAHATRQAAAGRKGQALVVNAPLSDYDEATSSSEREQVAAWLQQQRERWWWRRVLLAANNQALGCSFESAWMFIWTREPRWKGRLYEEWCITNAMHSVFPLPKQQR
jgi:hypothetical protein